MRLLPLQRGPVFCALVFSALASLSGNASAQVNLVANGSFETGSFASWTQVGNSTFNGVQCPGAALVPQGSCDAYFGPVGSLGGIQQSIATVPGAQYSITFAFSGDGGLPSQFLVAFGTQTLLGPRTGLLSRRGQHRREPAQSALEISDHPGTTADAPG